MKLGIVDRTKCWHSNLRCQQFLMYHNREQECEEQIRIGCGKPLILTTVIFKIAPHHDAQGGWVCERCGKKFWRIQPKSKKVQLVGQLDFWNGETVWDGETGRAALRLVNNRQTNG